MVGKCRSVPQMASDPPVSTTLYYHQAHVPMVVLSGSGLIMSIGTLVLSLVFR